MAEKRHPVQSTKGIKDGPAVAFSVPVLLVTLMTALSAAAVVLALPATVAWGAALVVAAAGGVFAMRLAAPKSDSGQGRAQLLLELADAPADRDLPTLPRLPGAWGALYEKVSALVQEARTARSAVAELERFRRQVELATGAYGAGKNPLEDAEELRAGPLHDLLEAAQQQRGSEPVVSRIPLGEEELVGVDGEPFPVPWPAPEGEGGGIDPKVWAELRRGVDELAVGLKRLLSEVEAGPAPAKGNAPGVRTPAQLVDAVVHTAADGIEDLAAGLMRANELASVAERVTNRATLLALNAALEATRSGSEAFAAIAEETRRLAEFAREATDTISRLANEIEYKVGETIHAIHETSDDAKTSLAALGSTGPAPGPSAPTRSEVSALLGRARRLRLAFEAAARESAARASEGPGRSGGSGGPGGPGSEGRGSPEAAPAEAAAAATDEKEGEAGAGPEAPASSSAGAFLTIDASVREDLVENDRPSSESGSRKDILLLEGLEPGSRMAG
jgi:hypothetical protein